MLLRQDVRNKDVYEFQCLLNLKGGCCDLGAIDAYFGPRTAVATLRTQRQYGMKADALAGPETLRTIRNRGSISHWLLSEYMSMVQVPYLSQRDNAYVVSSACNITSVAMCRAARGEAIMDSKGVQLEDKLYELLRSPAGQEEFERRAAWAVGKHPVNQVHVMLEWLLQYGQVANYPRAKFTTALTKDHLHRSLDDFGLPVILSTRFTKSGHVVVAIGITKDDDLIIHDPWGDPYLGYHRSMNGRARVLPAEFVWPKLQKAGGMWGTVMEEEILSPNAAPAKHKIEKTRIALDIDGVVKVYHGWDKDNGTEFVEGFKAAFRRFEGLGWEVVFYTCRDDIGRIKKWLDGVLNTSVEITNSKPIAAIYVDDRAFRFTGPWTDYVVTQIEDQLRRGPWWAGTLSNDQREPIDRG